MEPEAVQLTARYADMLQIGSRNMQNFSLLKAVGRAERPVLLKRGMSATIDEWLLAAEYILNEGNEEVVLCERGIRTFETRTRNTFDVAAVPVTKTIGRLPVIVDPSHASGDRSLILPLALAGRAAGADGVMVEVHPNPSEALSDGPQQLDAEGFTQLMEGLGLASRRTEIDVLDREIISLLGRRVARSVAIGRFKAARGEPLRTPDRESEILRALREEAELAGLDGEEVTGIFELILEMSRGEQARAVERGDRPTGSRSRG
jgi:chorismate mutase